MTFASGWALAGLVLLAPLVALHLRDRRRPVREVPSLVVWRELELAPTPVRRGLRRPALPLALALQAAALVALVFALAAPQGAAAPRRPAQVVVLDDSLWMSPPGSLAEAKRRAIALARRAPAGAPIRIVLAGAEPVVLYRGAAAGVARALAPVRATAAPGDLSGALALAAGLVDGAGERVTVIRAPEDPLPATLASAGELRDVEVSPAIADQGIFDADARCGVGVAAACEIRATVRNSGPTAVVDGYSAQATGRPPLHAQVAVAARSEAAIVLSAEPGEVVRLRLATHDAIAADDSAWVAVPSAGGTPPDTTVTLVGTPARSLALAQALVSVPGVRLRLRTPADYRRGDARASGLLVLDGWLPPGALPPAPALLVVDPPRLAGGAVGGPLADTVISGVDAASPLLDGVDLGGLGVDAGAAPRLTLPRWIAPLAWSPGGALLAAGDDGSRRVAVLAFEPRRSNLPRLAAFPLLVTNVVRWAAGWAPAAANAGAPIAVDATPGARAAMLARGGEVIARARLNGAPVALTAPVPGLYEITETGPGVRRSAIVAVGATDVPLTAAATPVDLRATRGAAAPSAPPALALPFLIAALIVLALEWLYAATRRTVAVS